MQVQVGPVPSASVLAWLDYAEAVLGADGAAPHSAHVPADVFGAFATYLATWRATAEQGPEFTWKTELPSELAEYLVLAFYRVAQHLAALAEERGEPLAPPAGHAFYSALVHGLLEALGDEGPGSAEFASHLYSFWPGV